MFSVFEHVTAIGDQAHISMTFVDINANRLTDPLGQGQHALHLFEKG